MFDCAYSAIIIAVVLSVGKEPLSGVFPRRVWSISMSAIAVLRAMVAAAEALMASVELMPLTASLRERAAAPFDRPLRALDAIHAATAVSVAEDLGAVVTYDADLFGALKAEGLTVFAPGPV